MSLLSCSEITHKDEKTQLRKNSNFIQKISKKKKSPLSGLTGKRNRFLEEKSIFYRLAHIENFALGLTSLDTIVNSFAVENSSKKNIKYVKTSHHRLKDICFKSSEKSDKSIIIFGEGIAGSLNDFEIYKNRTDYVNFLKCNQGNRKVSDIKLGKGLVHLNMSIGKVRNIFGSESSREPGFTKKKYGKLIYKKNIITENNCSTFYYFDIYFNKNRRVNRIKVSHGEQC